MRKAGQWLIVVAIAIIVGMIPAAVEILYLQQHALRHKAADKLVPALMDVAQFRAYGGGAPWKMK